MSSPGPDNPKHSADRYALCALPLAKVTQKKLPYVDLRKLSVRLTYGTRLREYGSRLFHSEEEKVIGGNLSIEKFINPPDISP